AWYDDILDYIPWLGVGIRQAEGDAAVRAMLAAHNFGNMQEFQLAHPGYGGTMTAGNVEAVNATGNIVAGTANVYLIAATSVTPTASGVKCTVELAESLLNAEGRGTLVYRSVNEAGDVNYVGITGNLECRAAEQLAEKGIRI